MQIMYKCKKNLNGHKKFIQKIKFAIFSFDFGVK